MMKKTWVVPNSESFTQICPAAHIASRRARIRLGNTPAPLPSRIAGLFSPGLLPYPWRRGVELLKRNILYLVLRDGILSYDWNITMAARWVESAGGMCGRMADCVLSASARTFIACNLMLFFVGGYAFGFGISSVFGPSESGESLPALLLIAGMLTCAVSVAGFALVLLPAQRKSPNWILMYMICLVCAAILDGCFGLSFLFFRDRREKTAHYAFGLAFILSAVFQTFCVAFADKQRRWMILNPAPEGAWTVTVGDNGCLQSISNLVGGGATAEKNDVTLSWPTAVSSASSSPRKVPRSEDEAAKEYYEPDVEEGAAGSNGASEEDSDSDNGGDAAETDAMLPPSSSPEGEPDQVRNKYAKLREKYKLNE